VLRTGGGVIFGVDSRARKVSTFGSLVTPQLIASWGVSVHADGYAASRACITG
jgi:hypothetical protein